MGIALLAAAAIALAAILLARRDRPSPTPSTERPPSIPSLTDDQQRILAILAAACADGDRSVVYRTEWAGFLPYPVNHWVEVGGRPAWHDFPVGWSHDDLEALAAAGMLRKVSEERREDDEHDTTIVYELQDSSGRLQEGGR